MFIRVFREHSSVFIHSYANTSNQFHSILNYSIRKTSLSLREVRGLAPYKAQGTWDSVLSSSLPQKGYKPKSLKIPMKAREFPLVRVEDVTARRMLGQKFQIPSGNITQSLP
jgi:hypothetical protein